MNAIILPLEPKYIRKIHELTKSGQPAVDIRKHPILDSKICILYATSRKSKVIAYYIPGKPVFMPIQEIWNKYMHAMYFETYGHFRVFAGKSTELYVIPILKFNYLLRTYKLDEFIQNFTTEGWSLKERFKIPYFCKLLPTKIIKTENLPNEPNSNSQSQT